MKRTILPFVVRRNRPVIEAIDYGLVRQLAADGDFSTTDYALVRRLADAAGVPFTGHAQARAYAETLPVLADSIDETVNVVNERWGSIAKGLFVTAIVAGVLGVLALVGLWGEPLLAFLKAAWNFGWRIALAVCLGGVGFGLFKFAQTLAEEHRRKKATKLVQQALSLRADAEEARQLTARLTELAEEHAARQQQATG